MNTTPEINNLRIKIGSASKGGAIEIHGDSDNPEEFRQRIDNAYLLLEYANQYHKGELQPKPIMQELPKKLSVAELLEKEKELGV